MRRWGKGISDFLPTGVFGREDMVGNRFGGYKSAVVIGGRQRAERRRCFSEANGTYGNLSLYQEMPERDGIFQLEFILPEREDAGCASLSLLLACFFSRYAFHSIWPYKLELYSWKANTRAAIYTWYEKEGQRAREAGYWHSKIIAVRAASEGWCCLSNSPFIRFIFYAVTYISS